MKLIVIVFLFLTFGYISASKKLDLDDISIKGELHNDQKLRLITRKRNELKNYVKFRVNFRKRMVEELPVKKRKRSYYYRPIE